ncbi:hypothetical protein BK142_19285 [Paenibacillus glucanolyticus]|nr:hypothetical protein BK142_19285 [Paenibacillus glucanolyticus]
MLERNSTTSGLSCHGYVNVNESRRRLTPINESICTAEVRTVTIAGEPWFVAKDVCTILEMSNPSQALSRLDEDEKTNLSIKQGGSNLTTNIAAISEPGLYSSVLRSRKPEARAFKRWITHEVIPSIRRNGMYATDTLLDDPDLLLTVTRLTEERRARLE